MYRVIIDYLGFYLYLLSYPLSFDNFLRQVKCYQDNKFLTLGFVQEIGIRPYAGTRSGSFDPTFNGALLPTILFLVPCVSRLS